jgi:hypothetical protein
LLTFGVLALVFVNQQRDRRRLGLDATAVPAAAASPVGSATVAGAAPASIASPASLEAGHRA